MIFDESNRLFSILRISISTTQSDHSRGDRVRVLKMDTMPRLEWMLIAHHDRAHPYRNQSQIHLEY